MNEVAFAQSGDVSIAYRVVGDGPVDLVYVQGAFMLKGIDEERRLYAVAA